MNLFKLRTEKGYTQGQVAILVGCSLSSYRLWEQGVTTPTEENQKKLEEVLDKKRSEAE